MENTVEIYYLTLPKFHGQDERKENAGLWGEIYDLIWN